MVVGLALAAAATAGFAACGNSTKTQPGTPAGQTPGVTTAPTSPPTTKAPGGGGPSF